MFADAWRRLESRHRAWRYRVRIDPREIAWLRDVLRPGDVTVDAGAYKGGYTFWMRHAVGRSGYVYAFEPQPDLATFLEGRVEAFGWSNVTVEGVALSSGSGSATLMVPGGRGPSQRASIVSAEDGARRVSVRTASLDECLAKRAEKRPVRLVKCDVEGHELDVFKGAATILEQDRPIILFECEARHQTTHTMEDVFEHLASRGYRGWFFQGDGRADVADFRADRDQVTGRRPYINNFIFEPTGSV